MSAIRRRAGGYQRDRKLSSRGGNQTDLSVSGNRERVFAQGGQPGGFSAARELLAFRSGDCSGRGDQPGYEAAEQPDAVRPRFDYGGVWFFGGLRGGGGGGF